MLVISEQGVGHIIEAWLKRFNEALMAGDAAQLGALFREDSHWRDIVSLGRRIRTVSGRAALAREIILAARSAGGRDFAIDTERHPPRIVERAGEETIEAILRFETKLGTGAALLRLKRAEAAGDSPIAWVLTTALESLNGYDLDTMREAREEPAFEREFNGPNWLDKRKASQKYEDRDPAVLIVGGGHAGITAAAYLRALNVDTLIVDRMARVGDNWRLRYHGLKLHNQVHSNHLPFLSFPKTWPKYIPKDKIANWLLVVSSTNLSSDQLLTAYHIFLLPAIDYPLQLTPIPHTHLVEFTQSILTQLHHALKLNRNFPNAALYDPMK